MPRKKAGTTTRCTFRKEKNDEEDSFGVSVAHGMHAATERSQQPSAQQSQGGSVVVRQLLLCLLLTACEPTVSIAVIRPLGNSGKNIVRCVDAEANCLELMYSSCAKTGYPNPIIYDKGSNQDYESKSRAFAGSGYAGGSSNSYTVSRWWFVFACGK